ncbi:MAG: rhomboid family intramembrane serine protease [Nitrososphaerales archaeon]
MVVLEHTYFQLFTSIFVTDSAIDVILNALAVIILDAFIDSAFNHTRYLGIFFFSALLGNALTLLLGPIYSSAGASGGIFGLFAATFAYRWAEDKKIDRGTLILFAAIFVSSSIIPGVNWMAHVGGSIGGFIAGPLLYFALKKKLMNYESISDSAESTKLITWGLILFMIIGSAVQFYLFVTG